MRVRMIGAIFSTVLVLRLIGFSTPLLSPQTANELTPPPKLGPYGRCASPSNEGISICSPPFSGALLNAPFQVIAAATSGRGPVRHMELWADGKKIAETSGTPFDPPITLNSGSHELTLVQIDITGAYTKSAPLQVNVVAVVDSQCPAPDAPGVNLCEPAPKRLQLPAVRRNLRNGQGKERCGQQNGIVDRRGKFDAMLGHVERNCGPLETECRITSKLT